MLQSLIRKPVSIRLKWNSEEYHGTLISVDSYMNIQLGDAVEVVNGKESTLGMVLIRCNNVLWVGEGRKRGGEDTEMGGA